MALLAWSLIGGALFVCAYAYIGYPVLLFVLTRSRRKSGAPAPVSEWPSISIAVPAYNEEAQIRGVLDSLLQIDYPREKMQILVMSDASSDQTDDIVSEYADRGVELLRLPRRAGKTAAENAARGVLRGEIVVNTDASIRIRPDALKRLISTFADPTVGVASGRDISVGSDGREATAGEARYVGYEMAIRALETRLDGIIGASGCFYAIRTKLYTRLPDHLSRDFASALIARLNGFRSVSVDEAVCFVPRTSSLLREYRRKVRTVCGGIQTLWHMRRLLDPFKYPVFGWMLFSHKICRWLTPIMCLLALVGVTMLAMSETWALLALAGTLLLVLLSLAGWSWSGERPLPRMLAIPAFLLLVGNVSVLHAWIRAFKGENNSTWEPTRRDAVLVE